MLLSGIRGVSTEAHTAFFPSSFVKALVRDNSGSRLKYNPVKNFLFLCVCGKGSETQPFPTTAHRPCKSTIRSCFRDRVGRI